MVNDYDDDGVLIEQDTPPEPKVRPAHWGVTPLAREEMKEFPILLVVSGSRTINDPVLFDKHLRIFIQAIGKMDDVLIISGRAHSGADHMAIEWCKENKYPWVEYPADWDQYKKAAGFIRNREMAEVGTHLFSLWDGKSPGTKHMLEMGQEFNLRVRLIVAKPSEPIVRSAEDLANEEYALTRLKETNHGSHSTGN